MVLSADAFFVFWCVRLLYSWKALYRLGGPDPEANVPVRPRGWRPWIYQVVLHHQVGSKGESSNDDRKSCGLWEGMDPSGSCRSLAPSLVPPLLKQKIPAEQSFRFLYIFCTFFVLRGRRRRGEMKLFFLASVRRFAPKNDPQRGNISTFFLNVDIRPLDWSTTELPDPRAPPKNPFAPVRTG